MRNNAVPLRYRIIPDLVSRRVRETPDRIAFCIPDDHDAWQRITWSMFARRVARIAAALRNAGLRRGHRAAILAPTSMDWEQTQMACLALGVSVAGIDANYPTGQRDQALRSIKIAALFVQDETSAASIPVDVRQRLDLLLTFGPSAVQSPSGAASIDSLLRDGTPSDGIDALPSVVEPDDEALVLFSSGTTGQPKPVAYTHRQVLTAVTAILGAYPDIAEGSHLLCWLPLANLFQRIVDFCGMERGAISYVISDPKEVMRYLPRANPHLLIGVPRFYERIQAGIGERLARLPRPISAVAAWAFETGARRAPAAREAGAPSVYDRGAAKVADWLVFRRLRRTFGSNLRYLVSGSAPMPLWLLDWFDSMRLPVFEAYGVSENIVPVAMNRPGEYRRATVGRPIPGQEVRLAEDGEILVRGPGVFDGYLAISGAKTSGPDPQGFWPTGDYGEFDEDGFLRVKGRKSDIFKLATGRWIAPTDIEAPLRRLPYVEHVMVLGAGHRFVVALLSIDSMKIAYGASGDAAATREAPAESAAEAIRRDLDAAMAALGPFQRPTGVLVTTRRFTIEGGELTANLKLRRSVVEAQFATPIQGLLAALERRTETQHGGVPDATVPFLLHWA